MSNRRLVLVAALAGGLGWGIRGVFGGESGAMVPGALFGLCVALAVPRARPELFAAVGALAFSLGGSMTYGQTIGLVQNAPGSPTHGWGMLGLAVKGGVWIGLGSLLLGALLLGPPVRCRSLLFVLGVAFLWFVVGRALVNGPHSPPQRLPLIYFSDRHDPKPRPECWGGLWLAYLWLLGWAARFRTPESVRLSLYGLAAGAVGFPLGESLQAWGHWAHPFGAFGDRWVDWWKVMEVAFGAVAGAGIGLGATRLRGQVAHSPPETAVSVWESGLLVLWCAAYTLADMQVLPLGDTLYLPFLGIALPLLLCASSEARSRLPSAHMVGCILVLTLSAANLVAKAHEEALPGLMAVAALAVTCIGLGALIASRQALLGRLSGGWLIIFIGGTQTLLVAAKSCMEGPTWAEGARGFWHGSSVTVVAGFCAATAAVAALLGASGVVSVRVAPEGESPRPGVRVEGLRARRTNVSGRTRRRRSDRRA